MKQKIELKEETDKYTIIVGEFNIPLSTMDRTRHRVSKNIDHQATEFN